MKKNIFCLLLSLFSIVSYSQVSKPLELNPLKPLITDTVFPLKKRPWLAAAEVVGINMGVWAFDRYILHGDWAYIDKNTIKRNFEMGFYWDNDNFQTNLFNHPYHGSLYFGAARSNGMNYWQSSFFSLGGSLMWELFMECELPSKNDLIATSIGGMAMGETLFRLSDLALDNRATGWERFGREAFGLILSPGRGLTRIINGDAWKSSGRSGKQFPNPDITFKAAMGLKFMELKDDFFDEGMGACVDLMIGYGNLYKAEGTKPYDYFVVRGSFNLQKAQPLIGQLNLMGRLWGKQIYSNKSNELHFGVFQHYDYYDSDTISDISNKKPYEIGTPASFGVGLIFKGETPSETWKYRAFAHFNGIALGGSMSDYYHEDDRSYNWGSGYSMKMGGGFSFKEKLTFGINFENYHIYTWKGYPKDVNPDDLNFRTSDAQGDKSNARFNILNPVLEYKFNENWSIAVNEFLFVRRTHYNYKENVSSTTTETRLMLAYKF